MNPNLHLILNFVKQAENLTAEEKDVLIKATMDAENELAITEFKLERTEKVKRTTSILLEETIEELEWKRKAVEAQNRELEIEGALEKVRSRSLAMHKSDELQQVVSVVFERLRELNISMDSANINIFSEGTRDAALWIASPGQNYASCFHLPYIDYLIPASIFNAKEKGDDFFSTTFSFEEKNKYFNYLFEHSDFKLLPDDRKNIMLACDAYTVSFAFTKNAAISIHSYSGKLFSDKENDTLKRFARVFEQAYIRFLDLQKAEAQAREANIEASLERVRSKAMAMQKSEDLANAVKIVFEELDKLNLGMQRCGIGILDKNKRTADVYTTTKSDNNTIVQVSGDESMDIHPLLQGAFEAWSKKQQDYSYDLKGDDLKNYYQALSRGNFILPESQSLVSAPEGTKQYYYNAIFPAGGLFAFNDTPFPDEAKNVMKRFADVFNLTYTRFNDLKQAEAQAREAKIEAGLERVRSRTMAMQRSDELSETAFVLYQQFKELGEAPIQITIGIFNEEEGVIEFWVTDMEGNKTDNMARAALDEPTLIKKIYAAWKAQKKSTVIELAGKELQEWVNYRQGLSGIKDEQDYSNSRRSVIVAFFSKGLITLSSQEPKTKELVQLLERFAGVFEGTYTRFNDLKQAEAQARESQIQLALERVRARTMAMQHSDELKDAAALLFQQAKALGVPAYSCGYNIWEKEDKVFTSWMSTQDGSDFNAVFNIPLTEDVNFIRYAESKEKGEQFFILELRGERMQEHYAYLKTIPAFREWFDYAVKIGFDLPETQIHYIVNFSHGNLLFISLEPCSEFQNVFKRFAAVFEQTYTRFLDLQKAEAQARESQIELGLERVRARAMAMQKSDELSELVNTVFKELTKLDFALTWCIINIIDENSMSNTVWAANPDINKAPESYHMLFEDYPFHHAMMKGWKERKTKYVYTLEGNEKKIYDDYLFSETEFKRTPEAAQAASRAMEKYVVSFSFSNFGGLQTVGDVPLSEANLDILSRFGKVFDLTYTRFNDLQKSEAQARESQIELSLERVRARTMAMQKSEELKEVIQVVFEQFIQLNINIEHTGFILDYKDRDDMHIWLADQHEVPSEITIPYFDCAHWNSFNEARKKGTDFFANHLDFEEKNKFYQDLFNLIPGLPDAAKEYYFTCPGLAISTVLLENVGLYIENFSGIPYTDEENNTLMRFGKVFQQTYTRFLDLKKAEAQAREARIEAALEKVRSRTMAMQRSDELSDTAYILFQQFKELGENPIQITIGIINETEGLIEFRVTDWSGGGSKVSEAFNVSIQEPTLIRKIYEAWKQQQRSIVTDLAGQELEDWIKYRNAVSRVHVSSGETGGRRVITSAFFSKGHISFSTPAPRPMETIQLLERFAGVFDLTYTRFLDLKLMEAQARKERIEAALERVRSSSLAMHKTDELKNVVKVVFENLRSLGLKSMDAVNINIFHKGSKDFDLWIAAPGQDYTKNFRLPYLNHPIANDFFKTVESGSTLHKKVYPYEVKNEYFEYMFENSDNKYLPEERKRLVLSGTAYSVTAAIATHSSIFVHNYNGEIFSAEDDEIILRFSQVFDQAYKRYLDLQKAELLMRDAVKQASLDRIRGQVASMRSTEDLQRITPLIWQELGKLDIPFIRCGVFIMDEEHAIMQAYLSTPHGESLAVLNLSYNYDEITTKTVEHWRRREVFRHHWTKEEFLKWMRSMIDEGQINNQEAFQGGMTPPESLFLHFIPFPQGMLYVGAIKPLSAYELELLASLAEAFSVAYSRYEDFIKLEKAKFNTETTLTELRAAQSQLIQAEKMASLGELTAGIAHEIQNPLNFVNNFSEVSNELLDEMKEELAKGNNEFAFAIAEDVKQNLEKINHHGKRADAIVKGMLQHSRSSSGVMEPTDMNALADEYLRLCYHGLRAKDKSFNATMKTDFDESIQKINVIPQEIGRVMLNLLTNAFYAVNEKRKLLKSEGKEYEPTVSVVIGKENGKLSIKISDNGSGIPQHVLDKIFQPFFTTKPAGEGTGLGLSLSYDIIKVHGGEIIVNTKAGDGSEFVVYLPFN